jgi:glycerol-3-phosphate acyltransferase PlsY
VAVTGYLLGSIPFGLIITQRFIKTDIRRVGSGKIGTTNVLRAAGKMAAVIALLLDIAKGATAVSIGWLILHYGYHGDPTVEKWLTSSAQALGALAAIGGHTWSIFLKFSGGRGVATFIGGLIAMYWPAAGISGALMLFIGFQTRYMSLGSIIGSVAAFVALMAFNILRINFLMPYPPMIEYVIYAMLGSVFILVMHQDNISRLTKGTERKIGEKAKEKTSSWSSKR